MTSFGKRRVGTPVQLNVYDLSTANEVLYHAGLGLYHTGVEILGVEYTFAHSAGIFSHTPRAVPNAKFREQIDVGHFDGGGKQVQDVLADLGRERYGTYDYDILKANCNHFAAALCYKLLRKSIPGYINRAADIGACLSCLIPKKLLENSPVNAQDNDSSTAPAYTVKAPVNRRMNDRGPEHKRPVIDPSQVFAGTGNILGSTTSSSSSTLGSSSTNTDTLTDRREKARAAALARLERSSNDNKSNTNITNTNTQSIAH